MICVLDFRREMGLWHGIFSVSQRHPAVNVLTVNLDIIEF